MTEKSNPDYKDYCIVSNSHLCPMPVCIPSLNFWKHFLEIWWSLPFHRLIVKFVLHVIFGDDVKKRLNPKKTHRVVAQLEW